MNNSKNITVPYQYLPDTFAEPDAPPNIVEKTRTMTIFWTLNGKPKTLNCSKWEKFYLMFLGFFCEKKRIKYLIIIHAMAIEPIIFFQLKTVFLVSFSILIFKSYIFSMFEMCRILYPFCQKKIFKSLLQYAFFSNYNFWRIKISSCWINFSYLCINYRGV